MEQHVQGGFFAHMYETQSISMWFSKRKAQRSNTVFTAPRGRKHKLLPLLRVTTGDGIVSLLPYSNGESKNKAYLDLRG